MGRKERGVKDQFYREWRVQETTNSPQTPGNPQNSCESLVKYMCLGTDLLWTNLAHSDYKTSLEM